jgi:hypothetical protein
LLGAPQNSEVVCVRAPEWNIIRENMNESKGLLQNLVLSQILERTAFFGPKRAARQFDGRKGGGFHAGAQEGRKMFPAYPFFMELKNSSLFFVARSLSNRNSVASRSSMPKRSFRRIQTFGRISGGMRSSSRRVPERLTLKDG